ncbi:hypothetical protein LTR28_008334 [Elasticomyces elasticus]|nr:hypothetical protein LTR28_008334 [Elasticomyces elasticus]
MSAEPDHVERKAEHKPKVKLDNDPSGSEKREELETSTAILRKKKKPNSLM